MKEEQIFKLMEHLDNGNYILIINSGLLDAFVENIRAGDPKEGEDPDSWVYDSDTFTGRDLAGVGLSDVEVYAPISDWANHKFD